MPKTDYQVINSVGGYLGAIGFQGSVGIPFAGIVYAREWFSWG